MRKKKRKLKIKKIIAALLIITILILLCIFAYNKYEQDKYKQTTEYKLIEKGYSEDDYKTLKNNLSEEELNKLLNFEYDTKILNLIRIKEFKFDNLERYLNYNETDDLEEVVYLVNMDIDKLDIPYSNKIMSLTKEQFFIKDNLERYINYSNNNNEISTTEVIKDVNSNIDNEYYTNIKDTDLSKGNLIITNKYYKLSSTYVPEDLVSLNGTSYLATRETAEHFKEMTDEAKKLGYTFKINSAYRSYATQESLYNRYVQQHGFAWAEKYSARPGHSEHQTGLAIDMVSASTNFDTFENTKEFEWMQDNAHKYGFILRYDNENQYITGYSYEPWHYRYVGVEAATKIHELGITFEEYYAYYVENGQ